MSSENLMTGIWNGIKSAGRSLKQDARAYGKGPIDNGMSRGHAIRSMESITPNVTAETGEVLSKNMPTVGNAAMKSLKNNLGVMGYGAAGLGTAGAIGGAISSDGDPLSGALKGAAGGAALGLGKAAFGMKRQLNHMTNKANKFLRNASGEAR